MADDQRPPKGVFPTDDEIAERAYEMLQAHGATGPPGVLNFWKLAEAELLERAAARAIRPVAARQKRRRHD